MVTINPANFHQTVSASASRPASMPANASVPGNVAVEPPASGDPTISGQARVLLSLYESAGQYIKTEHMTPYAGQINGHSPPSAYVNIEKYNNYLFDKAADDLVLSAKEHGVHLEKSDVLAQLKKDNLDIAELTFNDKSRKSMLSSVNVFFDLTVADIDNFTAVYISAKDNGLDLTSVGVLAFERAIQNRYRGTEREGDSFPYDWNFSEADPGKIEAAKAKVSDSVVQAAAEIRAKLQGNIGLSDDFLQYLLNPKMGLASAGGYSLDFLSKLVDIHNQQHPAPTPAVTHQGQER